LLFSIDLPIYPVKGAFVTDAGTGLWTWTA